MPRASFEEAWEREREDASPLAELQLETVAP
jgi:hypothetical protein